MKFAGLNLEILLAFQGNSDSKLQTLLDFFCLAMEKPLVTESLQIIQFVHPAPK